MSAMSTPGSKLHDEATAPAVGETASCADAIGAAPPASRTAPNNANPCHGLSSRIRAISQSPQDKDWHEREQHSDPEKQTRGHPERPHEIRQARTLLFWRFLLIERDRRTKTDPGQRDECHDDDLDSQPRLPQHSCRGHKEVAGEQMYAPNHRRAEDRDDRPAIRTLHAVHDAHRVRPGPRAARGRRWR